MKLLTKSMLALVILISVASCCQQDKKIEYINPVVAQRADPWVTKSDDGFYYMISTAPEYDRIEIIKSKTINDLGNTEPNIVWRKHETGIMGGYIWAPELHRIDGKWYIYFAAGDAENIWNIRMYALSNESTDPTQGEWKEEGRIMTEKDSFSLDATTFEHNGKRYLIWAQAKGSENSSLYMSEMETPVKLKGPEIVITSPELEWETRKYKVNEGPAVIKRNGKIFVTYSASATNHNYCMGLLWADENADLMNPEAWNKLPDPVFKTNDSVRRFGPGHNSFTVAEDGKTDVLIYHARVYKEIRGFELNDINRHTFARTFTWDENGFPDFGQELAD
nr:glycoside hydrolase family 43 protein [uncultured Carboxylicivirga sp.]